jgi:hypothetical protein
MTPSAPTEREAQPLPKIGPCREKLDQLVLANEGKASRERLTLIRLFEELRTWVGQRRVDRVDKRPELRRLCFDIDLHGELAERSAAHRGDGRDEPVKACWSDASSPIGWGTAACHPPARPAYLHESHRQPRRTHVREAGSGSRIVTSMCRGQSTLRAT